MNDLLLDMRNVTKVFSKGTVNEHIALNNLDLQVRRGEFITLLGTNGAGKSTLFNAISGTFEVDDGIILLDDHDITYEKEHKRALLISRIV